MPVTPAAPSVNLAVLLRRLAQEPASDPAIAREVLAASPAGLRFDWVYWEQWVKLGGFTGQGLPALDARLENLPAHRRARARHLADAEGRQAWLAALSGRLSLAGESRWGESLSAVLADLPAAQAPAFLEELCARLADPLCPAAPRAVAARFVQMAQRDLAGPGAAHWRDWWSRVLPMNLGQMSSVEVLRDLLEVLEAMPREPGLAPPAGLEWTPAIAVKVGRRLGASLLTAAPPPGGFVSTEHDTARAAVLAVVRVIDALGLANDAADEAFEKGLWFVRPRLQDVLGIVSSDVPPDPSGQRQVEALLCRPQARRARQLGECLPPAPARTTIPARM